MSGGKNLNVKLDTLNEFTRIVFFFEIIQCLLRLVDILEHSLDLADDVVTTLNLKLLDDLLFSLIVNREFVEKTISQKMRVCNDELITTIEAAEELNHLINLFLNIIH